MIQWSEAGENTAVCRLYLYGSRLPFTEWKGSVAVTCLCRRTESQTGQFPSHPEDRAGPPRSPLYHPCPPRDGARGRHAHRVSASVRSMSNPGTPATWRQSSHALGSCSSCLLPRTLQINPPSSDDSIPLAKSLRFHVSYDW